MAENPVFTDPGAFQAPVPAAPRVPDASPAYAALGRIGEDLKKLGMVIYQGEQAREVLDARIGLGKEFPDLVRKAVAAPKFEDTRRIFNEGVAKLHDKWSSAGMDPRTQADIGNIFEVQGIKASAEIAKDVTKKMADAFLAKTMESLEQIQQKAVASTGAEFEILKQEVIDLTDGLVSSGTLTKTAAYAKGLEVIKGMEAEREEADEAAVIELSQSDPVAALELADTTLEGKMRARWVARLRDTNENREKATEAAKVLDLAETDPAKFLDLVKSKDFLSGLDIDPIALRRIKREGESIAKAELKRQDRAALIKMAREKGNPAAVAALKAGKFRYLEIDATEANITRLVNIQEDDERRDKADADRVATGALRDIESGAGKEEALLAVDDVGLSEPAAAAERLRLTNALDAEENALLSKNEQKERAVQKGKALDFLRENGPKAAFEAANAGEIKLDPLPLALYKIKAQDAWDVELRDDETAQAGNMLLDNPAGMASLLPALTHLSDTQKVRFRSMADSAVEVKLTKETWNEFLNGLRGNPWQKLNDLKAGKYKLDDQAQFKAEDIALREIARRDAAWKRSQTGKRRALTIDLDNELNSMIINGVATRPGAVSAMVRATLSGLFEPEELSSLKERMQLAANGFLKIKTLDGQTPGQIRETLKSLEPAPGDHVVFRRGIYLEAVREKDRIMKARTEDGAGAVEPSTGPNNGSEAAITRSYAAQSERGVLSFNQRPRPNAQIDFIVSAWKASKNPDERIPLILDAVEIAGDHGEAVMEQLIERGVKEYTRLYRRNDIHFSRNLDESQVLSNTESRDLLQKDVRIQLDEDTARNFAAYANTMPPGTSKPAAYFQNAMVLYARLMASRNDPNAADTAFRDFFPNFVFTGTLRIPREVMAQGGFQAKLNRMMDHMVKRGVMLQDPVIPRGMTPETYKLALLNARFYTNAKDKRVNIWVGDIKLKSNKGPSIGFSFDEVAAMPFGPEVLEQATVELEKGQNLTPERISELSRDALQRGVAPRNLDARAREQWQIEENKRLDRTSKRLLELHQARVREGR